MAGNPPQKYFEDVPSELQLCFTTWGFPNLPSFENRRIIEGPSDHVIAAYGKHYLRPSNMANHGKSGKSQCVSGH